MTTRPAPQSAPSSAPSQHLENARYAVSLGVAFAILCAVVLDAPQSSAAGGLFELLFGGGYTVQQQSYGYGGGHRSYGQRRHARHSRSHYAHARRHYYAERRTARHEQRASERREQRLAEQRAGGRREQRVAERRAAERRRVAAERHSTERRYLEAQQQWRVAATQAERDQMNITPAVDKQIMQLENHVQPDSKMSAPIEKANASVEKASAPSEKPSVATETVSFADSSAVSTAVSLNRRAVCVRACDGYFFPIANKASDISAQQSCEKLCPGAHTQVFLMPSGQARIDDAVAVQGGQTYAQFVAKLNPADAKSKSCGCPPATGNLTETSAFQSDLTLRPGDTVVTPQGVRVVRRGSHYPFKKTDFLSLAETRDVSRSKRGALAAIEKAMKTPHGRLAVASNSERRHHHRDANL